MELQPVTLHGWFVLLATAGYGITLVALLVTTLENRRLRLRIDILRKVADTWERMWEEDNDLENDRVNDYVEGRKNSLPYRTEEGWVNERGWVGGLVLMIVGSIFLAIAVLVWIVLALIPG